MPPKTRTGVRKTRRKEKKNVAHGHAHIKSTFNNTIVSITDPAGAVIAWASSGQVGFKGSRKSTPFAAQLAAEAAARRAQEHGMKKVDVFVKGPGPGRETAIRSLQAPGSGRLDQDVTPRRTTAPPQAAPHWVRPGRAPAFAMGPRPGTEVPPRQTKPGAACQRHMAELLKKIHLSRAR